MLKRVHYQCFLSFFLLCPFSSAIPKRAKRRSFTPRWRNTRTGRCRCVSICLSVCLCVRDGGFFADSCRRDGFLCRWVAVVAVRMQYSCVADIILVPLKDAYIWASCSRTPRKKKIMLCGFGNWHFPSFERDESDYSRQLVLDGWLLISHVQEDVLCLISNFVLHFMLLLYWFYFYF